MPFFFSKNKMDFDKFVKEFQDDLTAVGVTWVCPTKDKLRDHIQSVVLSDGLWDKLVVKDDAAFSKSPSWFLPNLDFHALFSGADDATKAALWSYVHGWLGWCYVGDQYWYLMEEVKGLDGVIGEDKITNLIQQYLPDMDPALLERIKNSKVGKVAMAIIGKITPELLGVDISASQSEIMANVMARREEVAKIMKELFNRVCAEQKVTVQELIESAKSFQGELQGVLRSNPLLAKFMESQEEKAVDPRRQETRERLKKKLAQRKFSGGR